MFFDDDTDGQLSSFAGGSQQLGGLLSDTSLGENKIILELVYATENERNAPTLMPYPQRLIDRMMTLVASKSAEADRLAVQEQEEVAEGSTSLLPFHTSDILRLEIQRAQFFLSELMRTRIEKIEKLAPTIAYEKMRERSQPWSSLTPPAQGSSESYLASSIHQNLSENEAFFAERLFEMQQNCLLQGGLRLVPEPLQKLVPNLPHGEGEEILPRPNLNKRVFVLALENLGEVQLDSDLTQEVNAGEIFIVPYRSFQHFIADGRARLV